jgi:hypothetical protein
MIGQSGRVVKRKVESIEGLGGRGFRNVAWRMEHSWRRRRIPFEETPFFESEIL